MARDRARALRASRCPGRGRAADRRAGEPAPGRRDGHRLGGAATARGRLLRRGRSRRHHALAVPMLIGHHTRMATRPGVRLVRDTRLPAPIRVCGVACASPERATYDAMRLAEDDREAVVVLDMAAAAEITSIRRVASFVDRQVRRPGVDRVRRALPLASEHSRSPQETRLGLVWVIDAGLPPPLVNRAVQDRSGRLVGVADLLDVEAGVAGEYDGAVHRARARHRKDVERLERFRAVSSRRSPSWRATTSRPRWPGCTPPGAGPGGSRRPSGRGWWPRSTRGSRPWTSGWTGGTCWPRSGPVRGEADSRERPAPSSRVDWCRALPRGAAGQAASATVTGSSVGRRPAGAGAGAPRWRPGRPARRTRPR